jgi:hypothetical protein
LIDIYRLEQFRFYLKRTGTVKCKNGHLNKQEKVDLCSVVYLPEWENKYNLEEFERRINELSGTEVTDPNHLDCPDCKERSEIIHSHVSYSSFGPIVVISPTYFTYDLTKASDSPIEIPDKVHIEGKEYHLTAYVRRENGFDMNVMFDGDAIRAAPDVKDLIYHYVAVIRDESSGKWYQFDDTEITEVEPTYKYFPLETDTFPIGNLLLCNRPAPSVLFYISNNETDWKGREGNTESEEESIRLQTDESKILEKIMNMKVKSMKTALKKAERDQDGNKAILASRLANYMIQLNELNQVKEIIDAKVKNNNKMGAPESLTTTSDVNEEAGGALDSNPSVTGVAPESQSGAEALSPSVTGDALGNVDGQDSSTDTETNDVTLAVRISSEKKKDRDLKNSVEDDEKSSSDTEEEEGSGNNNNSDSEDSRDSVSTDSLIREAHARKRKKQNDTEAEKKKKRRSLRIRRDVRSSHDSIVPATSNYNSIVPATSRTLIRYADKNFPLSNKYKKQHEQFIQDGVQFLTENTDEAQKEEIANLLQQIRQYSFEQRNSILTISALAHPDDLETIIENIRGTTKNSKQLEHKK